MLNYDIVSIIFVPNVKILDTQLIYFSFQLITWNIREPMFIFYQENNRFLLLLL